MASLPILTVLEHSQVSPSPETVANRSLPLTFFDFLGLAVPPTHTLFFYEFQITKTRFIDDIIPKVKNSLSVTLQHFFPFTGKLIIFPARTKKPEIRYVEGDYVPVTFAECTLDFNNLTGNHPRDCDQFYHLIPLLGATKKVSDYVTIPVFSVQVTYFPNHGLSIGMTNHHSLGDASTRFHFMKAWTSISLAGSDELFLANGTLPCFDRLINRPELDEIYLKHGQVERLSEDYKPPSLSGPSDKVRVTVILTRTIINRLKKFVLTRVPTIAYVSSFTISCAYIWSCIAKAHNDELELFCFPVGCRARVDPPIPAAYFGNCASGCGTSIKTIDLIGVEGFVTAAKKIGENLHKLLTNKDGVVKDFIPNSTNLFGGKPKTIIAVSGTPKMKFYDLDFGWGKPKKYEMISIDYSEICEAISVNASKESSEDFEIGVCLPATEMETFLHTFNNGLEAYI